MFKIAAGNKVRFQILVNCVYVEVIELVFFYLLYHSESITFIIYKLFCLFLLLNCPRCHISFWVLDKKIDQPVSFCLSFFESSEDTSLHFFVFNFKGGNFFKSVCILKD